MSLPRYERDRSPGSPREAPEERTADSSLRPNERRLQKKAVAALYTPEFMEALERDGWISR
ncbi:MAG: hypothetical protein OXE86_03455 [Alphaproteobacteria bacterium]|nr:hypothetical protein [Alphaproteobacteria bacterium]